MDNIIKRIIVSEIKNKIDSINSGVIFLYGESGSGKSTIIDELMIDYPEGVIIKFEDYNKFDIENLSLFDVLKSILGSDNDIHIYYDIKDCYKDMKNANVTNNYNLNNDIKDEITFKVRTRNLFRSYTKPIIYLDAIENVIQEDRLFMEEIIDILVKNGVKVVITSRTLENKYNTNSFNITHFNQEEFDEFIKLNMPESNSHINTIQNLCSTKDNYYNNITLSLLYSLYIEDKQDLFKLISDIKSEGINIFGVGNLHLKNDRFIVDMQVRILKKILGNNKILTSFIQKVYILKTISKPVLDKLEIEYSQQEWNEYEKFIKINGSKSRSENREIEYTMHDCVYTILYDFYNDKLTEICKNNEVYSSLFKIVEFWANDGRLLKIEILKFCNFVERIKPIIILKENEELIGILLFLLGNQLYSLRLYEEARKNYYEAEAILIEILIFNPDNYLLKLDLAGVYNNLGLVLKEYGGSKYKEALVNYEKSQIIYEEMLQNNQENNSVKINIAKLFINKGVIFRRLGNHNKALESYSKSENILQQLSHNDKKNDNIKYDNIKYDLGKVFLNKGIILFSLSIFEEAIINYEKSQIIYEEIIKKNPENESYKTDLGKQYSNMGLALFNLGKNEEAIINYEKAKKSVQEILNINPDNDSIKIDIIIVYINLGAALVAMGKNDEAINNFEKANIILQEILKKSPDNDFIKRDLNNIYVKGLERLNSIGKSEVVNKIEEYLFNYNIDNHSLNNDFSELGNIKTYNVIETNCNVGCLVQGIKQGGSYIAINDSRIGGCCIEPIEINDIKMQNNSSLFNQDFDNKQCVIGISSNIGNIEKNLTKGLLKKLFQKFMNLFE
ncbi:MAG: hypothetical protein V3575_06695, partial [Candidatus Absconditabacteria bacterium]